ncbi:MULTISPECIES: nitric oxide reductase transcriptional regulator NorR [Idiomarinaceae]|uniref:Nitric oxide reductase transcriptional regulator NorR n=2 Tax=Pseudidiomarina TaxID=2800384 RepID=A0AB39X800_9GAMM|nr:MULTISPECIES: nitric oxide reductase transcriptional regulator NorR [Idiomarinaceae]MDX1526732.1 nitric oxide reductase transcriptional regulator NorR [Pseudidiomarina maritima]MDT7526010.1 nitric oxide reductase transcriptional regulator NorR [Pseudidiomarina sp. GXY010]MRJ41715.1 nitric oxide reductase transcriptional regulator NorR [Idiomarina sp. FeN1]NCU57705.1 nitric oxide reductase transcriptional regulator NorR [Idiomarina sp. FenA--70]NCU60257.1 nitric oxide reductase transcription
MQDVTLLETLIADLVTEQPAVVRLEKVVKTLRQHFHCGAVVLLKLEQQMLKPIASIGLAREALGRRFIVHQHPRLATIMASREAVRFEPDSHLADPYDGLIEDSPDGHLAVHDCMGISLHVEGKCWGVLTLDALTPGTFDTAAMHALQRASLLVEAAIRMGQIEQSVRALRNQRRDQEYSLSGEASASYEIIGRSAPLLNVMQELSVVAGSDLPVLLLGETGVGKELFARQLHRQSQRAQQPLVYVNCAALPEALAESELFGHTKGAFSGATSERAGRFDSADGGTIFLDEVGELPPAIQAKLLRVLQNGEIQRLGSDRSHTVNVRVVAATNRDLKQQIKSGDFRADLYHRLSVYPLPIPPLRERSDDIPVLAGHFLELNRARLGVRALRLTQAAEHALLAYDWPGNVRELEHTISRAAIKALSIGAAREDIVSIDIGLLDLPGAATASVQVTDILQSNQRKAFPTMNLKDTLNAVQRQLIEQALEQADYKWTQAARILEIDASNLHKLAQRLGLK